MVRECIPKTSFIGSAQANVIEVHCGEVLAFWDELTAGVRFLFEFLQCRLRRQ